MITAMTLAYSVLMYVMMASILTGVNTETERNLVSYETSAVKVMTPEMYEDRNIAPLDYTFDPSEIGKTLDQANIAWTTRTNFVGEIILNSTDFNTDGSLSLMITAVDVVKDGAVFATEDAMDLDLSQGSWLAANKPQVIIGQWLAQDLGAELDDVFLVSTKTKQGYTQVLDLRIVGIVNTSNNIINNSGLYVSSQFINEYLQLDNTVSEINIAKDATSSSAKTFDKVQSLLAGFSAVKVYSWQDIATSFTEVNNSKKSSAAMVLAFIAVIASIGIANTVLMSILERVREIGMLMAIGLTKKEMRALFITEATLLGIMGAIAGLAMAICVNIFLVQWGIDYTKLIGPSWNNIDMGYRTQWLLKGVWRWSIFVIPTVFSTTFAVLIGFLATVKIKKMQIVECLRYQ